MITCECRVINEAHVWTVRVPFSEASPSVFCPQRTAPATETTWQFARKTGLPLVINAGLYDSSAFGDTNKPEGVVICNGNVVQNKPVSTHPGSMPLVIDKDGRLRHEYALRDAEQLASAGVIHAVCGFMPIVTNGKPACEESWPCVRHFSIPHARQIIGQYLNGDYCVITTEGVPRHDACTGFTIAQMQDICIAEGLWYAYNLDGGTSTATILNGKQINPRYRTDEGRIVPTYIGFVPQ